MPSRKTLSGTAALMTEHLELINETVRIEPQIELGVIMPDYSLYLFGFRGTDAEPFTFPPSAYDVLRFCAAPFDYIAQTPDGVASYVTPAAPETPVTPPLMEGGHPHGPSGSHGGHTSGNGSHTHPTGEGLHYHRVLTPPWLRPLMPGDRVAVAWLDRNRRPCILGPVVSGRYFYDTLAQGFGAFGGDAPIGGTPTDPGEPTTPPPAGDQPWSYHTAPGVYGPGGQLVGVRGPDGETIPVR